jgi:uncharacterized protein YprB with RNaseH-like and TPR domain
MTADFKARLAVLRRRITRIERKPRDLRSTTGAIDAERLDLDEAEEQPWHPEVFAPVRYEPENFVSGEVVENEHGRYFLGEKFFPAHRRHGNVEFSSFADLSRDLLQAASGGDWPDGGPDRWAFLDTETTGIASGTGTCAFLIGIGTIEPSGFRVRLFFMRDYDEEAAMLSGVESFLSKFDVLVTYNGKAYDAPLLETRYILNRSESPLARMAHLDLLFAARRLWRLRLASCRLIELEREILGVEREGDLPGELIPYHYFEYLRTRQAFRLVPLLHHNTMDIVTLAALTAVVLPAFASADGSGFRHGEDLLGLARWLRANGRSDDALALYRRAIDRGLADPNLFRAMWEMAALEKRAGRRDRALAIWNDLGAVKNAFRCQALQELAKHYEHAERDYALALEMTSAAQQVSPAPELERRRLRLDRKSRKAAAQGPKLL